MKYPCSMCGSCCKRVNKAVENIDVGEPFPYKWDETGRCENLNQDNSCAVYENRPLLCNIDAIADKFGIEKVQFYKANISACNKMMDEDNVPFKFKIPVVVPDHLQ